MTGASSLLVRGGYLVDAESPSVRGDILIEDGAIAAIGTDLEARGVEVLDARDRVVIPGLINAHTHSNQALEKGLCDRLPLDAWMVLASYGGAGTRLSPRDLYISALVGAIEMLKTGTTCVLDCARADFAWLQEGLDSIMQAYQDVGIRAAVAAQYADLDFYASIPIQLLGDEERKERPRRAGINEILGPVDQFLVRWKDRHPRLQPMLGPSSLPRCSTELFEASLDLAQRRGVRLQSHLLSARSQVLVAQERYGGSTVDYLARIGALKPWVSFAHAIWLDPHEVELFAESECVAVHNPVSNLKLGSGVAPAPALRMAGATVALGADGASSNDSQNMFETTKMAGVLHRVALPPDQWPSATDALDMCWRGGAAALGQPLGRLSVGCRADLTILDERQLFLAPSEQVINQLVYSEVGRSVESVIVDGQVIVRQGRVTTVDEEAIHAEAQTIVDRIFGSLPERLQQFETRRPELEALERAVSAQPLPFARSYAS